MNLITILLGALLAVNGTAMLLAPEAWYGAVPGVADSGPLNAHFVRDLGWAYALAGGALLWRAFDPVRGWPAALTGALFLCGHALVHGAEAVTGHAHGSTFGADVAGIYLPAALALWLAWPARGDADGRRWNGWPWQRLLHREVAAFEQGFGYDAAYMHEIIDTSVPAFLRFNSAASLAAARGTVPPDAWYAAKISVSLREDCGPCAQLAITMAERDGVAADTLRAITAGDEGAMNADTLLGCRFARAVLDHAPEADALRAQIETRWGRRAVVAFGLALAATRTFPLVRYALGHGRSCTGLVIEGRPALPRPGVADAA